MVQLPKLYTMGKMVLNGLKWSEVLINKQKFFFDSLCTLIIYSTTYIELLHLCQKCNNEKETVSALINKTKTNKNPNVSLRRCITNLVVKDKNPFCVIFVEHSLR